MQEPNRFSFASQHLSLNAWCWGDAQKPLLILVHGGLDHARSWDWVADALIDDYHIVAPDLRGHGMSNWAAASGYPMHNYVLDLFELAETLGRDRFDLVGHSLGGNIATRYAALYPDRVTHLVSIEGLGPSPKMRADRDARPIDARLRDWLDTTRKAAARSRRALDGIDQATARMAAANGHLSAEQAEHLARHGIEKGADGKYRWRFDPMVRASWDGIDLTADQMEALWTAISCPVLLCYGADSWASDPSKDGRAVHFRDARTELFERAGHWLHHDRFEAFMPVLRGFLKSNA